LIEGKEKGRIEAARRFLQAYSNMKWKERQEEEGAFSEISAERDWKEKGKKKK